MSVYRGGKPKDKNPAKPPKPQPQPTPQPQVRQPDSELIGLNDHRQRHGHDPLDDPEAIDDGPEVDDQIADSSPPPPSGGGFYDQGGGFYNEDPRGGDRHGLGSGATKLAKSAAGKKIALAASGFFAPVIIVVALLLLAAEAGLQTEQVARAIVGVRFSRLYGQMSKRLAHVSDTFTYWETTSDNNKIEDIHNRRHGGKRGLMVRALGISSAQINRDLGRRGFKFEYEDRGLGTALRRYQRVTKVVDRKGRVVLDVSQGNRDNMGRKLNDLKAEFRDSDYSRLQARRAVRDVAFRAGIKFSRWRQAMDTIRNKIRGPPRIAVATSDAVSNDIVTDKGRVRRGVFGTAGVKVLGLFGASEPEIDGAARGWANKLPGWISGDGKRVTNFRNKVTKNLGGESRLKQLARFARVGSVALLASTIFCMAFEIVGMITQLARLKIFQQMDTAVNVLTTASQMKVGDMEHAIANDFNGRFDGFADSTTYQVLHDGVRSQNKNKVESTIKYINHHFNIKKSFGSAFKMLHWFTSKFTQWLEVAIRNSIAFESANLIHSAIGSIPGVQSVFNGVVGFLSGGAIDWDDLDPDLVVERFMNLIPSVCKFWLNPLTQIVVGGILGIVEVALTFLSGGAWAAISVGLRALVQTIFLAFVVSQVAERTSIDEALTASLMPEAVAVAAGVSSALSDEQDQGVENYLKVDYGGWHLSEAQAMAEGGHWIDRQTAVAQDKAYIAQYRQNYANEGVWSNIASPRNPFSVIAKLQSWLPSSPTNIGPSQLRSTGSWVASAPMGWVSGSAQADLLTDYELAELLYPSQGRLTEVALSGAICRDIGKCPSTGDFDVPNPENHYTITETNGHGESLGVNDSDDYFEVIESAKQRVGAIGFEEYEVAGEDGFDFETNTKYVENMLYGENGDKDHATSQYWKDYSKCLGFGVDSLRLYQAGITSGSGDYDPGHCSQEEARRYLIYYQDCNHISTLELTDTNSSPMLANSCDHLLPTNLADGLKNTDPVEPGEPIRYRELGQTLPNLLGLGLGVFDQPAVGLTKRYGAKSTWQSTAQVFSVPWEARRWRTA